jgi:hypothetical protein
MGKIGFPWLSVDTGGNLGGFSFVKFIDEREAHYEKFIGKISDEVMHSTDVKPVHVDIYTFPPAEKRPYYTLLTGGMSDVRQNIPAKFPHLSPRAEILTYVSKPQGWMYNVLKGLAEMPSDDNTFLHWYHSVPNGKPMTAVPSELTAYFFVPPYLEDQGFNPMIVGGEKTDFLVLVPITNQELNFKREHGANGLLDKFDQNNFNYVIDESRKSFV